MDLTVIHKLLSNQQLRVNVSKNQRKFRKSQPRSKNQFVSFFVYRNLNVCKKGKWG